MSVAYDKDTKQEYTHFCVNGQCSIAGQTYRPSICYAIDAALTVVVEKMALSGQARRFTQEMIFVNAIPRPLRKNTLV